MDPHAFPLSTVSLTSKTWLRDSRELYDFEESRVHTQSCVIPRTMSCVRIGEDVQAIDCNQVLPGSEHLFSLQEKDGVFFVDGTDSSESDGSKSDSKKLWLVVRDLSTGSHELAEGDVMKLGRFRFRVRQLVAKEDSV